MICSFENFQNTCNKISTFKKTNVCRRIFLDKLNTLHIIDEINLEYLSVLNSFFLNMQEEKKKKRKFKPYTGRMKSPGLKVTESLEQTEMTLLTQEIMASMPPPPQEKLTGLITMPASCHSILKVTLLKICLKHNQRNYCLDISNLCSRMSFTYRYRSL